MAHDVEDISPQEAAAGLRDGDILLIDIREPYEFAVERIPGALNYPMSTFDASVLPTDGARRVVLVCRSGQRTMLAAVNAQAAGFDVNAHIAGGVVAWREAGLPVFATDPATGEVMLV